MSRLLMTHTDLDGLSVLVVADILVFFYDAVEFIDYSKDFTEGNHEALLERAKRYDEVFLTDISPTPVLMNLLRTMVPTVYLFDHHESTGFVTQEYPSDPHIYYDRSRCGTQLFFDWVSQGKQVPSSLVEYVHLVNVYDSWLEKADKRGEAVNLNRLFWKTQDYRKQGLDRYQRYLDAQESKIRRHEHFYFTLSEKKVIAEVVQDEDRQYEKALEGILTRKDQEGKSFSIFKAPKGISQIASRLLTTYKGLSYVIAINTYDEKEAGRFSVRSRSTDVDGGFDCTRLSWVAGGHRNAAAGYVTAEMLDQLWWGQVFSIPYKDEGEKIA